MSQLPATTALLIANWPQDTKEASPERLTSVLTPVLDKPILQRNIERLVQQGCRTVHLWLAEHATATRHLLGNGERWGITVIYHYFEGDQSLAQNFKRLRLEPQTLYWLVCGTEVSTTPTATSTPHACCWTSESGKHWSGIACVSGVWLMACHEVKTRADLNTRILSDPALPVVPSSPPWLYHSDADFLHSNLACLAAQTPDGTAVHTGRGVVIHPTAQLRGPLYLGDWVHIGANTQIGPHTIVGAGALIDQGASVRNSVVLPDTYVGPELDLHESIAAPGQLAHIANGVLLKNLEPTLLASVHGINPGSAPPWGYRLLLKGLQLMLWPLYQMALRAQSGVTPPQPSMDLPCPNEASHNVHTVAVANTLPALQAGDVGAWARHFSYTFYPGLAAVARGQIALCGPQLRDYQQVQQLPEYWQTLYRHHPAGLLNEALFMPPEDETSAGHFACDAYAAAHQTPRFALSLCHRYLRRVAQECLQTLIGHTLK